MFKSHQEFAALYFRDRTQEEEQKDPKEEEPGDLKLFSDVNILIFALDSIGEKSSAYLDKVKTNLKRYKHWPEAGPTRMVLLKYEDDGISKLDVIHPALDDLIYLPMDRLVFLQKMEILLSLPKTIRPRFLFNQEVNHEIEISKITKLDRLSDVGLAIRNPIPLKRGLPGHFYLTLPGEKTRLELRGKVFRSEPHPEFPGQYLVYFTYFGLAKTDLSMIRRALSKAPRYQSLYTDDRSVFRFKTDDLFLEQKDMRSFGVAVVDPDMEQATNLAAQISKDMDRLKMISESSYSLFLHRYFDKAGVATDKPPRVTEENEFYKPYLMLTVNSSDLKCLSVEPPPQPGDLLIGHAAVDLFATPEKWLSLITEQDSKLVLEEAVKFALDGRPSDILLVFNDAENQRRGVNVKIQKGTADHLVTIDLSPANLSDISTKLTLATENKELDAIIADSAYIPDDTAPWIEGLRMRAVQTGKTKQLTDLKFFIISEPEARINPKWMDNPDILGQFVKPVDTRQLGFLLSEYLPNKNTVYQYENLGWGQPNLPLHVSKNVHLEMLSEFGATLRTKQILTPGTMVYLRRSIYDNAPNACLAARVYACIEHPSEKGFYQIFTTYFGINDQFLKFARTWIRENYAQSKAKEG